MPNLTTIARSHRVGWRGMLLCLAILGFGAMALPRAGMAGDYSHSCRSADGGFVMNDEELRAATEGQSGSGKAIPYRVLETFVLQERKGYCVSNHPDAKGARFDFASKAYVLRIAFRHQDYPITTYMLCQLDASGLPASFSCDKSAVTTDFTLAPQAAPDGPATPKQDQTPKTGGASRWSFEGGVLRLDADGLRRRFVVETASRKLRSLGYKAGALLFEGRREGQAYKGRVFVYRESCKATSFNVTGEIVRDGRAVRLTGYQPSINGRCRRSGFQRIEMVIELVR